MRERKENRLKKYACLERDFLLKKLQALNRCSVLEPSSTKTLLTWSSKRNLNQRKERNEQKLKVKDSFICCNCTRQENKHLTLNAWQQGVQNHLHAKVVIVRVDLSWRQSMQSEEDGRQSQPSGVFGWQVVVVLTVFHAPALWLLAPALWLLAPQLCGSTPRHCGSTPRSYLAPPTSYSVQEIAAQQGRKTTPARADGFGGGEGARGWRGEGARGRGGEGASSVFEKFLNEWLSLNDYIKFLFMIFNLGFFFWSLKINDNF